MLRVALAAVLRGVRSRRYRPPMANMAGAQDVNGEPVDRDQYASHLRRVLEDDQGGGLPAVSEGEARVIADLLDELAAVYPGEALGVLAREVSVRLWDRLGI